MTEPASPPSAFYLRLNDALHPVYEVDQAAGVVRLVASAIGAMDHEWPLCQERMQTFLDAEQFAPVEKVAENGGVVRYRRIDLQPVAPSGNLGA